MKCELVGVGERWTFLPWVETNASPARMAAQAGGNVSMDSAFVRKGGIRLTAQNAAAQGIAPGTVYVTMECAVAIINGVGHTALSN